jgi:selenocysteine lyase/cysteine desulfurase
MTPSASRRLFLTSLAGSAALPAFSSALATASSEEAFWKTIRRQFSFDDAKVPMNAANLCPSPTAVAETVAELTREIDVDCSFQNRDRFADLLEVSRAKVAKQLRVSADEIALVRNTSEANNTINNGLRLKAGDQVVLWDQNHPTNNVAWEVRARRFGLEGVKVSTPAAPASSDDLFAPFEKALTSRTRVLALTHASNTSGVRLPIRRLCELARSKGVHAHVDGAQTWGVLDVNLRELGCDSYAASAHKWFVGPKEVGLLYVRQQRLPEIWPQIVAPSWGSRVETDLVGARKLESMGQRDDAALTAIGATADFHDAIGSARIEARVLALAADLKNRLKKAGAKLVTPEDPDLSAAVCIIDVSPDNRQQLFERLYRDHGIAGATTGGLRLCPHLYNTAEHIERAGEGVRTLRKLLA